MRLKIAERLEAKHNDMVTAVAWTPTNQLYACSDEKVIVRWSQESGVAVASKMCDLDVFVTAMSLFASGPQLTLAVGGSDGSLRILNSSGRTESSAATAHGGAVTAVCWNHDGTGLATAGEDGLVKHWSPSAHIRSKLAQLDRPVHDVCWSPDGQSLLYTNGRSLTIKGLQAGVKALTWRAHDSVVLAVDWNPVSNLIVSGGEDGRYRVWDAFGRALFSSRPLEHPVTSLAWSPNGAYFAVGSYNLITLCDAAGWVHSRTPTSSGSPMDLAWSFDGTQLAAAGAKGSVLFAQVVERALDVENFHVELNDRNQVVVHDLLSESSVPEELDFSQRVIAMSLAHGHLVVVTAKACHVYALDNLSTPAIFEVAGAVSHVLQSEEFFALVDNIKGVQVCSYEGRVLSNPKIRGLRGEFLKREHVSLNSTALAIVDPTKRDRVLLFEPRSGQPLGEPLLHSCEVASVALNQVGQAHDRKLLVVDVNRDLFLSLIHRPELVKLASVVDSVAWNATADMLAALSDAKLLVWHAPGALFVDRDLLLKSRTSVEAAFLGPHAQFLSFSGTRYIVRRANGALFHGWVPPFTSKLQALVVAGQWMQAARLCRFAKEPALWAALAALALDGQELETAALALSAIDEYDKLEFVQQLVQIPTVEGRNAELALFRRRPDDAEAICLQAGLVYRAVKLNLRLFRWERALELAQHYKAHLDTVLAYRDRYLRATRGTETLRRFAELSKEIKWDWATVAAREEQELQRERAAGAAYRPPSLPRQPSAEFSPQASALASGDGDGAVY